jgi:GT2 family glycosyltransferase
MPAPRLSFLILNYNGGDLLRSALESIERQTFTDFEVIVVDNGSQDGSWDLPCFQRANWLLLRQPANTGFAEGNNIAFARSRGALVALVNNDTVLAPDWAEKVAAAFEDPAVGSVACRKLDSAGFDLYACVTTLSWTGRPADQFTGREHRPFGPVAAAAAYRRAALEQCGLFHPEFFAYYEDTDLAMRLVLFGRQCRYCNDALAWHLGSATGRQFSAFHRHHLRRNVELVYWINMAGASAWRHLPGHLLYELMAFAGMLARGQGLVFVEAKLAALRMAPWIRRERQALADKLGRTPGLRAARRNLESRLKPFLKVFGRGENAARF